MGFREVKGKVAIITGAARGIGYECAEALAAEGVEVIIADILPEVMESFRKIKEKYDPYNFFDFEQSIRL